MRKAWYCTSLKVSVLGQQQKGDSVTTLTAVLQHQHLADSPVPKVLVRLELLPEIALCQHVSAPN